MSEASPTKHKLDEFRVSLPPGDEHTEPTWEMLRITSYACNGATGLDDYADIPAAWR